MEWCVTNFLITFQATEEFVEGLALALGLGAVQRGGNIRLRHLSPPDSAHLAHQGYGRLKADDVDWADCLVVGIEAIELNEDLEALLRVVRALKDRVALRDKRGFVFGARIDGNESPAVSLVRDGLASAGMPLLAEEIGELTPERMMQVGNRLAEMH
jgi:hypothetical protein